MTSMMTSKTVPDNLNGAMNETADNAHSHLAASKSISQILAGVLVYGAAGFGLDYWWGTSFMVGIGIALGAALGTYAVVASTRSSHI